MASGAASLFLLLQVKGIKGGVVFVSVHMQSSERPYVVGTIITLILLMRNRANFV